MKADWFALVLLTLGNCVVSEHDFLIDEFEKHLCECVIFVCVNVSEIWKK